MQTATPIATPVQAPPATEASSSFKDVVAATTQAAQAGANQKPLPTAVPTPMKTDAGGSQKPTTKPTDKKSASDSGSATSAAPVDATAVTAVMIVPPVPLVTTPVSLPSPSSVLGSTPKAVEATTGKEATFAMTATDANTDQGQTSTTVDASTSQPADNALTNEKQNDAVAALMLAVPTASLESAPIAAASSTAKKVPAPTPAAGSEHDATPQLAPAPVETMPAALQAFSSVERAASSNDIQPHAPSITKPAMTAVTQSGAGKQKETAAKTGGPSTSQVGAVNKNPTGESWNESSSGRVSEFQKTMKAPANDAVQGAGAAVDAVVNGTSSAVTPAGLNAGSHSAMAQISVQSPAQIGDAPAGTSHEGGLATTASAAANGPGATTQASSVPALSSAQLVQSMRGSEMRIGMHSEEFGNISINTSLTHQTLAAQISFDHAELGRALSIQVPAMQEKLGNAYGVQTRVEVRDGNASFGGEARQQAGDNPSGQGRSVASGISSGVSGTAIATEATTVARLPIYDGSTRLDIRI